MKIKLLFVLQLIILNSIYSQDGILDTSFGTNGITITDASHNLVNDNGHSVLVKDNGSILITGYSTNANGDKDFALAQYDVNGMLDNTFGDNGIALLDINGFDDVANSSVLQSDGKIITVGYTNNTDKDVVVARFNSNGSLDTSYGTNGIYIYDSGLDDSGETVAILSDNKILVGSRISSNYDDYGILKITEMGTNDTLFGLNGLITTDLGLSDGIRDLKVQSDGKFLITGTSSKNSIGDGDSYDKALIRYNSDGSLDTSFNSTGIIFTSFVSGEFDGGYSIIIQDDGKIIVSGSSYKFADPDDDDDFALTRYNSDGTVDTSFGVNGTTITDFGSSYDICFSSLIQNDSKIILGGYIIDGTTYKSDFGIVRYNTNGIIDSSFGTNGLIKTDLNNNSKDYGLSLAFQFDSKIILAGYTRATDGTNDFAIARYIIDGNVGIDNIKNNSKTFSIYPNPVSEHFTIQNQSISDRIVNIEIYSIAGKRVKSIPNYNLDINQQISLENTITGVYIIKVSNNKTTEFLKIVKK